MRASGRAGKARTKGASPRKQLQRSKGKDAPGDSVLRERVAALERERDTLRQDLARSEARVRALEKAQAQARDRIAWALDTLHNILEGKG